MASSKDVQEFYDRFTGTRFSTYKRGSNLRIEKATRRVLDYVEPTSRVLEIGCGTGLVTQRISEVVTDGEVWACDISPVAVNEAKRVARSQNVHFKSLDILEDHDKLNAWLTGPVDIVVMIDVIEHIPIDRHNELFRIICKSLGDPGKIVLTYPSPMYQQYLQENNPEELQIIDESVTASHLVQIAVAHGLDVLHYSLEDVWMTNQYVHCVIGRNLRLVRLQTPPRSLAKRIRSRLKRSTVKRVKRIVPLGRTCSR